MLPLPSPTDKKFTGHQQEGELYFMQARFYDPMLGRFIQPDILVPGPANPRALNRYSYVLNNPLRYTDPTGYCGQSVTDAGYNNLLGLCGAGTTRSVPSDKNLGALDYIGDDIPTAGCHIMEDYSQCIYTPIVGGPGAALAERVWENATLVAYYRLWSAGVSAGEIDLLPWSLRQRELIHDWQGSITSDFDTLLGWATKMGDVFDDREKLAGAAALGMVIVGAGWINGRAFEDHVIEHADQVGQFIGRNVDAKAYKDLSVTATTSGLYRIGGTGELQQFLPVIRPDGKIDPDPVCRTACFLMIMPHPPASCTAVRSRWD